MAKRVGYENSRGIEILKLPMNITGNGENNIPKLIFDNNTVILVDARVTNSLPKLKEQ
jgi:hypothetical protein